MNERQRKLLIAIVDCLSAGKEATVDRLSNMAESTHMTVRNDLHDMRDLGMVELDIRFRRTNDATETWAKLTAKAEKLVES